jgi:hypothetical protein
MKQVITWDKLGREKCNKLLTAKYGEKAYLM